MGLNVRSSRSCSCQIRY